MREASAPHTSEIQAIFEERFTAEELETLAELLGRLPDAGAADGAACSAS